MKGNLYRSGGTANRSQMCWAIQMETRELLPIVLYELALRGLRSMKLKLLVKANAFGNVLLLVASNFVRREFTRNSLNFTFVRRSTRTNHRASSIVYNLLQEASEYKLHFIVS